MEVKRECERDAEEREHEDDCIHAILLTAGMILLMAYLRRATMILLVEQWRAWIFLILNLVLLAILFMSIGPASWVGNPKIEGIDVQQEVRIERTKKRSQCSFSREVEGKDHCGTSCDKNERGEGEEEKEEEEEDEEDEEVPRLSKEELNERVEAFIAMFRQHLVLDARKSEDCKFYNNINMKPSQGVNCLIVGV